MPLVLPDFGPSMKLFRSVILLAVLSLAACATQPQPDFTPPPKKPLDAKSQLETGRKY